METIDFVLPWVDPSDPLWQEERNKHDTEYNQDDKSSITRFRDLNTLKYVLRSIEKYCPWYHKIYLITTGHYPEWLDLNHPKIELVTHEKLFIDKTALPVFNSNAIEMNLINIPNLSEKFIYLNDDMIIWKPLKIERFFQQDLPVDFFFHSFVPRNKLYEILKGKDIWIDSINNNIQLINQRFFNDFMDSNKLYHKSYEFKQKISNFIYRFFLKKIIWINHWHHPQPYNKHTLEQVYHYFSKSMLETVSHKFRSSEDITPYLYRYWHLMQGAFEPIYYNDGLVVQITSFRYLEEKIVEIESSDNNAFICFNDQMHDTDPVTFDVIKVSLTTYLDGIFLKTASFEKSGV